MVKKSGTTGYMGRLFTRGLFLLGLLAAIPSLAQGQEQSSAAGTVSDEGAAIIIEVEIKGIINTGTYEYVKRTKAHAENVKARAYLVNINTPGGLLNVTRQILEVFANSKVPVIAYVSPSGASATSAGALIAQGAHVIAMAPGTNIGAAHPVGGQGQSVEGEMKDKVVNDTVAMAKSMAKMRGHNEKWIEEAVRKSVSATAEEALKLGAINIIAADRAALLSQLASVPSLQGSLANLGLASIQNEDMTTAEKVLHFLGDPNVTYLLMAAGGLGLYVEFTSPGVMFPGIFGGLCLLLAFISMQTLPVSTGAIALLVLGIALLIAEVFITSFGLLALGGIVSTVLGALFLLDPASGDLQVSRSLIASMTGSLVFFMGALALFLYKTKGKAYKGLDQFEGFEGEVETVQDGGRKGKMLVRGETWDFINEGSAMPARGDRVKVLRREGFTLVVRKDS
jgi:membrane-bound serine protease (ClpP class)